MKRGRRPASQLLTNSDAPSLDELVENRPADLDVALFAGSVAGFDILSAIGLCPDVMVGHSVGEMAALAAARAFTVSDATELVCTRAEVLRHCSVPAGGMVAVAMGRRRAESVVNVIDEPGLAVAVDNGPEQSVISGPTPLLSDVERIANAAGVRATRLRAAFPFHNPLLREAADAMVARTASLTMREPVVPVFSPILGRYVRSADDVRLWVERHLLAPVMFYGGLLQVHRDGVRRFVEVGARGALTQLVESCLPRDVTAVAPFRRPCPLPRLRKVLAHADLVQADPAPVDRAVAS